MPLGLDTVVHSRLSQFYHKLYSVASDCNFINKDEIVKFLYLTHNQNTRVHEHLLRKLTDTTSLADMLRMARVCKGTVHLEEISKQYLESVKMVKQVDAINHQCNNNRSKSKGRGNGGHRSIADLNLGSLVLVQIVVPVTHPGSVKHMAKNVSLPQKGTFQSIMSFQTTWKISRSRVEKSNQQQQTLSS